MKRITIIFGILLLCSCKNKQETPAVTTEESSFEMYEMSEMATLMEEMYAYHEVQKSQLEKGEELGAFPENFLKIHTATLTDASDNDEVFKNWANLYIQYEKDMYTDKENAKLHYNNAINACIMCHEQKCTGPIPRIKKLLIVE